MTISIFYFSIGELESLEPLFVLFVLPEIRILQILNDRKWTPPSLNEKWSSIDRALSISLQPFFVKKEIKSYSVFENLALILFLA